MSQSVKKPRLLPNLEELHSQRREDKTIINNIVESFDRLKQAGNLSSLERLKDIDHDIVFTWLVAKYGSKPIFSLIKCIQDLPKSLTKCQRQTFLKQCCPEIGTSEVDLICTLLTDYCPSTMDTFNTVTHPATPRQVMAPPTETCYECGGKLTAYHSCDVKYYSCKEVHIVKKVTLRCVKCSLLYNYAQFGDKHRRGFHFYPSKRPAVEVTDTVYFDRHLLELQCSLANHSWVSFQGFCESMNTVLQLPCELELTPKIVAKAFWVGEIENELRRIGKTQFIFKSDADLERCMDMIEECRQTSVYPHPDSDCTTECKERGCGKLWVTDGIWSLNFAHCMYQVQHSIEGFPTVNLPNVCTNSPKHGQAFCEDHCDFLSLNAPDVPHALRDFLRFCEALKSSEENLDNVDADRVDRIVAEVLPSSKGVGTAAASSQGTMSLLSSNPELVDAAKITGDEPLCRKDTGQRKLRKWSRGHQFVVRGGGHIDMWAPLYKSESPSQVFILLIQWLVALVSSGYNTEEMFLAYDNMCHLARMKAASKALPLPPPMNDIWSNITKIIDSFHLPNHRSKSCKQVFSPEVMKTKYPNFNTQVGEQTFTWLHNFSNIVSSMPKRHHLFYLHRMVIRRNLYTAKCYQRGKKPILPKKSK